MASALRQLRQVLIYGTEDVVHALGPIHLKHTVRAQMADTGYADTYMCTQTTMVAAAEACSKTYM